MAYDPENNPYVPGDPASYDLTWIVEEVKQAIALYSPLSQDFSDLHDYVMNYFDNLDITTEVRQILYEMDQDGSLDALIQPYIDALAADIKK